jgi:hypothetical protein
LPGRYLQQDDCVQLFMNLNIIVDNIERADKLIVAFGADIV